VGFFQWTENPTPFHAVNDLYSGLIGFSTDFEREFLRAPNVCYKALEILRHCVDLPLGSPLRSAQSIQSITLFLNQLIDMAPAGAFLHYDHSFYDYIVSLAPRVLSFTRDNPDTENPELTRVEAF